ncbi:MAG: hypothetical protein K0R10_1898 [Alphaproteobacteria bacterium]|jgi:hypothetical protein|nr:hypothetical protein [Alphaproteobacteria bacterium]
MHLHKTHLENEQIQARKKMLPEWAAIWEDWEEKLPVSEEQIFSETYLYKKFPPAVQKTYPINSLSEKIVSDCKALGYKYTPKELFLDETFTPSKEFPCRFHTCYDSHSFETEGIQTSGVDITISWCDEDKKVTWILGRVGLWMN